jgi:Tfp pilus assembly protein PilF
MQAQKPPATNYVNIFIAFGFGIAWAFFWAVDTMLAYVLFGGASFFLVLFFYNLATQRSAGEGSYQRHERHHRKSDQILRPQPKTEPSSAPSFPDAEKVKKINRTVVVVVVFVVGLVIFLNNIGDFIEGESVADQYQYYNQAEQFYAATQYDSAYYYYKAALTLDDQMTEALVGLGNTVYMQSKIDSARWYYEQALAINPEYTQARYNIGWWYYDQKEYRQSISELKILVIQDSSQLGAMQLVGDNFYALSEYDSAIRWYEGAYTNGARSRWLCHVMAYIYDTKNQLDQAIPLYKEAIQYDSTMVDIYVRLGELLPNEEGEVYRYKAAELKVNRGN